MCGNIFIKFPCQNLIYFESFYFLIFWGLPLKGIQFWISAINCTDDPYQPLGGVIVDPITDTNVEPPKLPPTYKKGVYDWDMLNKSFSKIVKYSCTEPGWGYPSNGLNEMYSMCLSDKTWNLTSVDECECKSLY